MARSYFQLTHQLIAKHAGGGVFCVAEQGIGRSYRLHAKRPGAELNRRVTRASLEMHGIGALRAEVVDPSGLVLNVPPAGQPSEPTVTVVTIHGPIEQRASLYSECMGWGDGHDAIAERMIAALELGDVVMVIDSPGGAHAGLQEAIKRVQAEKAEHGRHVCVYADEMIGSAAYWWACGVGDEIHTPESGIIGSIGARGGHESIAGALAIAGVAMTYFVWPGEGKVAFAPELPLSDLGKQRGERDVGIAGEAFAAAVVSARGKYGVDRKALVDLNADALSGAEAVRHGLADGVSSLEDVMAYALARASGQEIEMSDPKQNPETPDARAEEADHADAPPAPPEPPPADKRACESCQVANEDDAKYCKSCGAAMPGMGAEEDDDDDDEDGGDDAPPSSKPAPGKAAAHPPPPERATDDKLASKSTRALLGLREDASDLAVKTAVLGWARDRRAILRETGAAKMAEAIGAARAHASDARRLHEVEADNKALKRAERYRERMTMLTKLEKAHLPGYEAGKLFTHVDDKGELLPSGERRPARVYAEMKLGTLRGMVETLLKNGTPRPPGRSEPDANAARAATATVGIEASKQNPVVKSIVEGGRSTATPDQLAAVHAALFPNSPIAADPGV